MNFHRKCILSTIAFALVVCSPIAFGKGPDIHGAPLTPDPKFALSTLTPMLAITSGCKEQPKSVDVHLVGKSDDIRMDASGQHLISGWAKEQWLFKACGQDVPMYIKYTFQPDGQTKYEFSAK